MSGTEASNRPVPGARSLNRRDFFAAVVARVQQKVSPEWAGFRHRANPMLLKIDFGNERVHFEVWPDNARGHVEVGLHFEDGPASTAAYLAYFDQNIVEIKHKLGPAIELERWTVSWGHLFEIHTLRPLDRRFAMEIGDCLARQIDLLQPLVAEAAVPPAPREYRDSQRGRWNRGGRR